MLRKRSRAVGGSSSSSSKQGIMSEPLPLNPEKLKPKPKPKPNPSSPASTFQKHFSPKCFSPRFDSAISPTSILETKPNNPFFSDPKTTPKPPKITPLLETASKGLVEALTGDDDDDDDDDHNPTHNSPLNSQERRRRRRMVLFGSKLKIQIPSANPNPSPSPQSPIEFGFKNKESQLALLSPAQRALLGAASAKLVVANLVVSDLELSEDYTCVISHGPNPRTTHIFDNCVIESRRRRSSSSSSSSSSNGGGGANESDLAGGGFLSSCHACNKRLEQGDEVFMYRGEKAFCSSECRHQEMLFDEAMD